MKPPKVSIIIGAYNCEEFIQETIHSVVNQTFTDWELIIVDDASTDDTYKKIKEIADKRIKVIKLTENSNLPAVPRNKGIRVAEGEFIAFLDHDDIWLPKKLEKQLQVMEQDKDIFLMYSRCYVQKNNQVQDIAPKAPKLGRIFESLFMAHNLIPCSTAIMRNEKTNRQFLFDESKELRAIEDYDLWLRIACQKNISYINEPLVIYRLHQQSTSSFSLFFKKSMHIAKKFSHLVSKITLFKKCVSFTVLFCVVLMKFAMRSFFTTLPNKIKELLIHQKPLEEG